MHLSDRELLELHAGALFTHAARGRIRAVNEPDGARAPRFFFARSREGNLWRCRDDVDEGTARELERLAAAEPIRAGLRVQPRHQDRFLAALRAEAGTAVSPWQEAGPAYRFPDTLPSPPAAAPTAVRLTRTDLRLLRHLTWDLERAAREFERYAPFVAVIEEGFAVSLCHSARLTARAAEAGVETLEAYRGRGYAAAVVAAWAHAIRASGRIPLYSTSWDNHASQAVARRLDLVQYGTDLSVG